MHNEIIEWLKFLKFKVPKKYFRLRLESHPDYPSLLAVHDTLKEFGIEANACETNIQTLKTDNRPFLAHLLFDEGQLYFFKNVDDAYNKVSDFERKWSKIVLLIDGFEKINNPELRKINDILKLKQLSYIIILLIVVLEIITFFIFSGLTISTILTFTSMIGCFLSILIVGKELGFHNSISDKICRIGKSSPCEVVLFSKDAKLFSWLSWGDIGLIFFVSSIIYFQLIFLQLSFINLNSYAFLNFSSLIFVSYSLYLQIFKIKKLCILCLGILSILIINAAILLLFAPLYFDIKSILISFPLIFALILLFLAIWQILKINLQREKSSFSTEVNALKFKRDPNVFNSYLKKADLNYNSLPKRNEPIFYGSVSAKYNFVIACNPYCSPCAKIHRELEEIYKNNQDVISVTVRFSLWENNNKDKKVIAAKEIIRASKLDAFLAVKTWYQLMDIRSFRNVFTEYNLNVDNEIEGHIQWSRSVNIKGTPTVFLNGRKIPSLYNWKECMDIFKLI